MINPETDSPENPPGSTNISEDGSSATASGFEMEPFSHYSAKIEQLLTALHLRGFSIEEIQHGYAYQNCVYGLSSSESKEQQYVLRVPSYPVFEHDDRICETVVNDVALTEFLSARLPRMPVPRIKAYSATTDNILEAPFTIQTRIAGKSLEDVYADLSLEEKLGIVDQFVDLLVDLESIQFASAGTFAASPRLSLKSSEFVAAVQESSTLTPNVMHFSHGDGEFANSPDAIHDRCGPDLKALLSSHINGWIRKDLRVNKYDLVTVPSFRRMLAMLESLDREGAFADAPYPIVLHYTDLEPRNIMVSNSVPSGKWTISGIIDWDEAIAVPRPLARMPPTWIWDFDAENFTAYLNIDHHPFPEEKLNEEGTTLKKYFDAVARKKLGEKYLEDAYGSGRWLRRVWYFVRRGRGVPGEWFLQLIKKMEEDWEVRARTEQLPSATSTFVERAVRWGLDLEREMRKRL